MSVSNYTNWGNWAFVLLWINARLRPVGEGLRSAPSPSPLLRMRYHNMTAPDDSKIKQKTQASYTSKQGSTTPAVRAWPEICKTCTGPSTHLKMGCRSETELQPAPQQTVASAVQPLSSNCFTSFNECWQMPKKWSCTGRKSIVLIPSRFF